MKKKHERELTELAREMADGCIAVRIRLLDRVVTGIYNRSQQGLGVKVNQSSILAFLTLHPGASPGEVGRALELEKSTVSRVLGGMREKGWIEVASGEKRGDLSVRLTAQGERLLRSIHGEWTRAQDATRELLEDEGVRALRAVFDVLKRKGYAKSSNKKESNVQGFAPNGQVEVEHHSKERFHERADRS